MQAGVRWWSGTDLASRIVDAGALDDLVDAAIVVVDLRREATQLGAAPGGCMLRRAPCPVVVLVDPGVPCPVPADLVLSPGDADLALLGGDVDTAAQQLGVAAAAAPVAAGALAGLLRSTPHLPVDLALTAESAAYSMLLGGAEFGRWLRSRPQPARRAESGPPVVVRRADDRLELVLDRPDVHNAYSAAMRDALVEGLAVAAGDPSIRRVLLTGAGASFCSGGDLREFGTSDDPGRAHRIRTSRSPAALLHALGERVEVRVHGACVGAGVELPAFAGRVVASPEATFRLPELSMGLVPGAGGTVGLPRRIGAPRTLLLALSGLRLTADVALRWGLVDAVEPGERNVSV